MSACPVTDESAPPERRKFSGWRIVALAAVALAMTAPGQTVGVSVFVDPLMDGLGLSRSQISGAYMVGTLGGAAMLPFVGRLIDRWGVRLSMTVIAAAFAVALAGMAGVTGLVTVALGFVGIRLLGQGSLTLTATTSVAYWFDRRRGLASGVSTAAGTGLMALAPLALTQGIALWDWRVTWLVAGATVLVVVVPLAWLGMRDNPAAMGQNVEGDPAPAEGGMVATPAISWTRGEAARTAMFWAVAGGVAASGLIGTAVAFHQISLLGEQGLSTAEAAANFLPQRAAGVTAMLGAGWLIDRVRPKALLVAAMAALALGMVLAQTAAPGAPAIAFALVLGAGGGSLRALEVAAVPRLFGTDHLGAIRGLVMTLSVTGAALGPWLLAMGHEHLGSYGAGLNLLLALPVAVIVLAVLASQPDEERLARLRGRDAMPASG